MADIWDNRHGLARKYPLFLSPDSISYSSRINPIFSFEIEKFLNSFNVISLRDGVYPLLRFFFMNPVPLNKEQIIIIDEKLSLLVPNEWRANIFLRKIFTKEKLFPVISEECLLLISPDKDNLPLDILLNELDKKSQIINDASKISLFFSSCNKIGEEYASEDKSWRFIVLQALLQFFPDKMIEVLDWDNLHKKKMNGVKILEINPLQYYFTDSFLIHEFYQKGAIAAETSISSKEEWHCEHVSIYHGFYIYPLSDNHKSIYESDKVKKTFREPINIEVGPKNYTDLKLTTKSFQDFCSDKARQIYQAGK